MSGTLAALFSLSQVEAVIGASVKSISSIVAKEGTSRAVKLSIDRFTASQVGSYFQERGQLADALRALNLSASEQSVLAEYLRSELFLSVVRSVPAVVQTQKPDALLEPLILKQLSDVLEEKSRDQLRDFAAKMASELVLSSQDAWKQARDLGVLVYSGVALATQAIVAGEIDSIGRQLADSAKLAAPLLKQFELFERRYRRAVGEKYSTVRPEAIGAVKEMPIDDIFVAADLTYAARDKELSVRLTQEEMLASSFRAVVLGNPGAGKSTFGKKLCADVYRNYEEGLWGGRMLTPVFVALRTYAKMRAEKSCSILEFINIRGRMELQLEMVEDAIKYMLSTGRALVIFDGLDELLDTTDRLEIKESVESFVRAYPSASVLVTSREVGYEEAPLSTELFEKFRLEPFTVEQTAAYVSNWFRMNEEDPETATAKSDALIKESDAIPDLRENPLLLSLLCNLYREEGFLPANRPDVYERCAKLLFDTWDRSRKLLPPIPHEKRLRSTISALAYWIYSNQELQGGVTEKVLVQQAASIVEPWAKLKSLEIATNFISHCKGRAWVFTDVGSNRQEAIYGFTHNTFLEYFASEHVVKHAVSTEQLRELLLPRIVQREWDVVCQIAYQEYASSRSAEDSVIQDLLFASEGLPALHVYRIGSFLSRTLDLIYPSDHVRQEVIRFCCRLILRQAPVEELLSIGETSAEDERFSELATEMIVALLFCGQDMFSMQMREISQWISSRIHDDYELALQSRCFTFVYLLGSFLEARVLESERWQASSWMEERVRILGSSAAKRAELSTRHVTVGVVSWWLGELSLEDLLSWFGLEAAFTEIVVSALLQKMPSIAEHIAFLGITGTLPEKLSVSAQYLRDTLLREQFHPNRLELRGNPIILWPAMEEPENVKLNPAIRDLVTIIASWSYYKRIPEYENEPPLYAAVMIRAALEDPPEWESTLEFLELSGYTRPFRELIEREFMRSIRL